MFDIIKFLKLSKSVVIVENIVVEHNRENLTELTIYFIVCGIEYSFSIPSDYTTSQAINALCYEWSKALEGRI